MSTGSRTLDRIIAKHPKLSAESWRDSDGYWLVLEPGYKCAFSDCHTIHEMTVAECRMAIGSIQPCDCPECK